MSSNRNSAIDIFKYMCAIIVVGIHTSVFSGFFDCIKYIAIPFFFAVNGYYYMKKLLNNERVLFLYIKRLVVNYVAWSFIYYLFDVAVSIKNSESNIGMLALRYMKCFFLVTKDDCAVFHFWYITALIYVVILATIMYKLKCHILIIPICVVAMLIDIPNISAIYGFGLGYIVLLIEQRLTAKRQLLYCLWGGSFVLFLLDYNYLRINYTGITNAISVCAFVGVTLLILLNNSVKRCEKIALKCRVLASYTYYSHPLIMGMFGFCCNSVLRVTPSSVVNFFAVVILALLSGLILIRINNKAVNKIIY